MFFKLIYPIFSLIEERTEVIVDRENEKLYSPGGRNIGPFNCSELLTKIGLLLVKR